MTWEVHLLILAPLAAMVKVEGGPQRLSRTAPITEFPGYVKASKENLPRGKEPLFYTPQQRKPNYCFSSLSHNNQRVTPFLLITCTL